MTNRQLALDGQDGLAFPQWQQSCDIEASDWTVAVGPPFFRDYFPNGASNFLWIRSSQMSPPVSVSVHSCCWMNHRHSEATNEDSKHLRWTRVVRSPRIHPRIHHHQSTPFWNHRIYRHGPHQWFLTKINQQLTTISPAWIIFNCHHITIKSSLWPWFHHLISTIINHLQLSTVNHS